MPFRGNSLDDGHMKTPIKPPGVAPVDVHSLDKHVIISSLQILKANTLQANLRFYHSKNYPNRALFLYLDQND